MQNSPRCPAQRRDYKLNPLPARCAEALNPFRVPLLNDLLGKLRRIIQIGIAKIEQERR